MSMKVTIVLDEVFIEDDEALDPEGNPLVIVMSLLEYRNSPLFQEDV